MIYRFRLRLITLHPRYRSLQTKRNMEVGSCLCEKTSHRPRSSPGGLQHIYFHPRSNLQLDVGFLNSRGAENATCVPSVSAPDMLPRFKVKAWIMEGGSTCHASGAQVAAEQGFWMQGLKSLQRSSSSKHEQPQILLGISNSSSYFLKCFFASPNRKHSLPFTFPLNFLNPRVF